MVGSGKRMNVKAKVDSWFDVYNFRFDNGYRMEMVSNPSSTLGFYLTYMAVSVGYDMNISKYFNGGERTQAVQPAVQLLIVCIGILYDFK